MDFDLWSYSGSPEYVSLKLKPSNPSLEGGYIIFIHLVDGQTWIFSSCDPGRCVYKWKNNAKKYKLPKTKLVKISRTFILYSAVKNKIVGKLKPYREEGGGGFLIDLDIIILEAEAIMKEAVPTLKNNEAL